MHLMQITRFSSGARVAASKRWAGSWVNADKQLEGHTWRRGALRGLSADLGPAPEEPCITKQQYTNGSGRVHHMSVFRRKARIKSR